MLRALVWKEWRQLRALRWSGIGLGALLPVAFLAGAEAARRGLSPLGRLAGYSSQELFVDLFPSVMGFGLWPLMALLASAQAYCADRAAGAEWFLLERPVPRSRVWTARLLAVLGTVAAVAAGTVALWLLTAKAAAALDMQGWLSGLHVLTAGLIVTGFALVGGIAAASFLAQPFPAVLLGAVLASLPVGFSILLAESFPYAKVAIVPLGYVALIVLVPASVLASWIGLCRGEPAGRGRLLRAGSVMAASLVITVVAFFAVTPAAMRLDISWAGIPPQAWAYPFTERSSMIVGSGESGWIVDLASGDRLRFLPPPVWRRYEWKAHGSTLVVASAAGPLGSVRNRAHLDFYDERGEPAHPSLALPPDAFVRDLAWAGDTLLLSLVKGASPESELCIAEPRSGVLRPTGFHDKAWSWGIVGATNDGVAWLYRDVAALPHRAYGIEAPEGLGGAAGPLLYELLRVDLNQVKMTAEPILRDQRQRGESGSLWKRLSRTCRYSIRLEESAAGWEGVIRELSTARDLPAPRVSRSARWLADDRLIWTESRGERIRLLTAMPGESPRALREWSAAEVSLTPSPDGRSALVVAVKPRPLSNETVAWQKTEDRISGPEGWQAPAEPGGVPEQLVYETADDRFVRLPQQARAQECWATTWAGPRTLASTCPGSLALLDLERPDSLRYLVGRPPS